MKIRGILLIWDTKKAKAFNEYLIRHCGKNIATFDGARFEFHYYIAEYTLIDILSLVNNNTDTFIVMEDLDIREGFTHNEC